VRVDKFAPGENGAAIDLATRIAESAEWFWRLRGHLRQGVEYLERLLARAPSGTPSRARALIVSGILARQMGDQARALSLSEEGLLAWRVLDDPVRLAQALVRVAEVHARWGDADRARALLQESQALSDDARHVAHLEVPIVAVHAQVALADGDLDAARSLFEETRALGQADGDVHTVQLALRYLGYLAHQRADDAQASRYYRDALARAHEFGDSPCSMYALAGLAYVAIDTDGTTRAACLLGAVSRLREIIGVSASVSAGDAAYVRSLAAARAALGDDPFEAAWAEGRAMTLEQAVAYALDEPPPI